jgi:hypothetical protein
LQAYFLSSHKHGTILVLGKLPYIANVELSP